MTTSFVTRPPKLYDSCKESTSLVPNAIHIVGFEYDGTACFRKGTRFGPNAIREVSDGIETYSPYLDMDTTDINFYDLGNLTIKASINDFEKGWHEGTDNFNNLVKGKDLKKEKIRILTLGGEHSISYAPLKTYLENFEDLFIIHLDAHADLRDGYEGFKYSHASIIKRTLENFGPKHNIIQYGIRSGTREEYEVMRKNKTVMNSREDFFKAVEQISDTRPIYLTLDLDFFDPAYMPGTGTPEAGGEDFHTFIKLMKMLNKKYLVGADVVELSPPLDATGNSDVFATKVVREVLLALGSSLT